MKFKTVVKELIDAIPDISELIMCPSIFSREIFKHDCDSCPASRGNASDCYDESVCRKCWKDAIDNYESKRC